MSSRDDDAVVVRLDERALLQRHLRGDPDAFGALVAAHGRAIAGYIARSGVDVGDRDDVFQDVFYRVHRSAKTYQPDRPLRPWLFVITVNAVRTYFRRLRVHSLIHADGGQAERVAPDPDGQRIVEARQAASWLDERIDALPLPQREAVLLVCVHGMDQRLAAEVLDIPHPTLKTHLRRGRLALARALAARKRTIEREGTP